MHASMYPSIQLDSQISPNTNQSNRDYVDDLLPGYRFSPTDQELIVNYLQPKLESRKLPPARIHEKFIYDYNPEELAKKYLSVENKWYFMTPRERMCPNGNRPKRTTKKNGFWKTGNSQVLVCDVKQRMLGYRRNLAFYDEKKRKTTWLMTEYTTADPNLPVGNGTKLNNFVLCKIYKKEKKGDRNMANEDEGNEEQDQPDYEPSPRRRRLNPGSNLPNEQQHVRIQEANHHLVEPLQPENCYQQEFNNIDSEALALGPAQPFNAHTANQDIGSNHDAMITSQTRMNTSHYSVTNNSCSIQPQIFDFSGSSACDDQQNQSTMMATDEFLNGASCFTEIEAEQLPYSSFTDEVPQMDEDFFEAEQLPYSSFTDEVPQMDEDFFEAEPLPYSSFTDEVPQMDEDFFEAEQLPYSSFTDEVPQMDEDFFELNPADYFPQNFSFSSDDQVPAANNDTTTPRDEEDWFESSCDEVPELLPLTDRRFIQL